MIEQQIAVDLIREFVGCGSSRELLEHLDRRLHAINAVPARLYLMDADAGVYYPVYGLGCERGQADVMADQLSQVAGIAYQLSHRDEIIGALIISCNLEANVDDVEKGPAQTVKEVTADIDRQHQELTLLAQLLGPALVTAQEQDGLVEELRHLNEQIGHLTNAGELLRLFDLEVLLVQILQTALRAVDAQVGALLTPDPETGVLTIRVAWGLREDHIKNLCLRDGTQIAGHIFAERSSCCLAAEDIAEQLDVSQLEAQLTGLLVLPMLTGDRAKGVIILANPKDDFTEQSQSVAETVCDMAAIAIDNAYMVEGMVERERLEGELDIARKVQADMFPHSGLHMGAVEMEGLVRSCDETGGDYYTFLEHDGQALAMVGDVTGHGLGAALFTTIAHAMIQHQLLSGVDLLPALEALNHGLSLTNSGRFLTAALLSVDPETGVCRYFSAGHNDLLWIHNDEIHWLDSIGMPLGILPDYSDMGEVGEIQLASNDLIVLYTDGFVESVNSDREPYGEERFAHMVREAHRAELRGQDLIAHIFKEIEQWVVGVPVEDDLTLVTIHHR